MITSGMEGHPRKVVNPTRAQGYFTRPSGDLPGINLTEVVGHTISTARALFAATCAAKVDLASQLSVSGPVVNTMAAMNFKHFAEDIDSIIARDPAARSRLEVALTYPGFHAILAHRLSLALYLLGGRVLARVVSQTARWFTGIEIHPGATIGRRLFIDH